MSFKMLNAISDTKKIHCCCKKKPQNHFLNHEIHSNEHVVLNIAFIEETELANCTKCKG